MSMARAQLGPTPRNSAAAPSSRTMRNTPSKLRTGERDGQPDVGEARRHALAACAPALYRPRTSKETHQCL